MKLIDLFKDDNVLSVDDTTRIRISNKSGFDKNGGYIRKTYVKREASDTEEYYHFSITDYKNSGTYRSYVNSIAEIMLGDEAVTRFSKIVRE